ncbi:MAG: hypothetical protein ABJD58_09330 [Cyclobacteriaceae bacterium]
MENNLTPADPSSVDKNLSNLITIYTGEFQLLYNYVNDKDAKKITLFRLSITLFSAFAAATIVAGPIFYDVLEKTSPLTLHHRVLLLMNAGIAVLNMAIVKQYLEAHVAVLGAMKQVNFLRQAQDSLIYKITENKMPESQADLEQKEGNYAKIWGQKRILPLDNERVEAVQKKFFSGGNFTTIIMVALSMAISSIPIFIYSFMDNWHWELLAHIGVVILFLSGIVVTVIQLLKEAKLNPDQVSKVLSK